MSIGKDLLSSIAGRTDKACLIVHDVRQKAQALKNDMSQLRSSGVMTKVQSEEYLQMKKTRSVLANGAEAAQEVAASMGTDKTFFVQFNPSSLELSASNTPQNKRDLTGSNEDQNESNDVATAPGIEMTVALVFDKMNIYDAFMFDKFNTGMSVTTITNAASMLSDKTFTVQPYVEGLISALRNRYTQSMTFRWADFSFTGRLRQMNAQYTMFSVSGHPVRAQVHLRLIQDLHSQERKAWQSNFETLLSQKDSFVTAGQKVSNLFHLSL